MRNLAPVLTHTDLAHEEPGASGGHGEGDGNVHEYGDGRVTGAACHGARQLLVVEHVLPKQVDAVLGPHTVLVARHHLGWTDVCELCDYTVIPYVILKQTVGLRWRGLLPRATV